jgi:hypothetical protein
MRTAGAFRKNPPVGGSSDAQSRLDARRRTSVRDLPLWVKIVATLWVAVWFFAYAIYYPWSNFLHLSDIAIFLSAIGLWTSSPLLLSSQAVSILIGHTVWVIDILWTVLFGRHLIGGTAYMWDRHYPLWVRLMSLYHFALPVLLVWAVARLGYDRRALKLQTAIGAAGVLAGRFCGAADNINFAFRDPLFHRSWGPAPVQLLVIFGGMVLLVYLPTHVLLAKLFRAPSPLREPAHSARA